ncbi:MAG: H(+)-transporting ATPase [Tenericutes bacterium]|nr:H(+)-transporting ATPase [Mycoplasmatota bacterium]
MLKKIGPYGLITIGFLLSILIGGTLLYLPISQKAGADVSLVDAFFITISAICVTGLSTIDVANSFNLFGYTIIALLIQIGGLGIVCAGLSIILLAGQKIGIKERILIKDSLNLNSLKGIVKLVKSIFRITFIIEFIGALFSFCSFIKYYKFKDAIVISIFHSISAFNNAGFDLIGNFRNLVPFENDILLNLTTSGLIILGGLGFIVINEIIEKKDFKKISLHSKIVIKMSIALLIIGTLVIYASSDISLLASFFTSVSSRTAGFNTVPIDSFNKVSLLFIMILMFIGASPSSTGGGIKTSTFYSLIKGTYSICSNKRCHSFKREISHETILKSFIVLFVGMIVVTSCLLCLCIFEPNIDLLDLLFESISAFATVGLSTGITPELSTISKIVIMITMFIGRVGGLTLLSLWTKKGKKYVSYPTEDILIG